jgi:hypothetical protein
MVTAGLTEREAQLIGAFTTAWLATNEPFVFPSGGTLAHPAWPNDVPIPSREEVRPLILRGSLISDPAVAPNWQVVPSRAALEAAGDAAPTDQAAALSDPAERLATILEAAAAAHQADPSEPLHLNELEHADLVMDSRWKLPPDAVRPHDLRQLESLGLIGTTPGGEDTTTFWATPSGMAAVNDPASFIEERAELLPDDQEAGRLRTLADRFRAGDIAVGASGSLLGQGLRAALELMT